MSSINVYTTALLRFIKKSANLSAKELSWEEFCTEVDEAFKKLEGMNKPDLYSPYFKEMVALADAILAKISADSGDVEQFNSWINKELNLLEKQKRVKSYSRKTAFKDFE